MHVVNASGREFGGWKAPLRRRGGFQPSAPALASEASTEVEPYTETRLDNCRRDAAALKLVRGDAQRVGGGGFATEHEGAEGHREEAAADGEVNLVGGEIAFGADQPEDFSDGAVERGGGFGEMSLQGFRAGVEAGDELEVVRAGRGDEGGESFQRDDFGEPGVATLFGGLEGSGAPFFELLVLTFVVEVDLGALAGEGDNAAGADLGGFAHNGVHARAFGKGLGEGDVVGERRDVARALDGEDGGRFGGGREVANPLGAAAVEGNDGRVAAGAVDGDKVVRFLSAQAQGGRVNFGRDAVNAEVGHGREASEEVDKRRCPSRKTVRALDLGRPAPLPTLRTTNYDYQK